jgi:TetR/AcrR family transcriptional repressor of nem operon
MTDTKKQILDIAEDLLQDKGYNGFSYQHIAKQLLIKNAAIHYHYPSKEDLGLDIIKRARGRFNKWIHLPETQTLNAWERLDLFLTIYYKYLDNNKKVCLVGSLSTDYNTLPESMKTETQLLIKDFTQWLCSLLNESKNAGVWQFRGEPESKANAILTSLMGGLQLARVTDRQRFFDVVAQIKLDLQPSSAVSL